MSAQPKAVRLPAELIERIDALRGDVPRERWVRRELEARLDLLEAETTKIGPNP